MKIYDFRTNQAYEEQPKTLQEILSDIRENDYLNARTYSLGVSTESLYKARKLITPIYPLQGLCEALRQAPVQSVSISAGAIAIRI